MCAIETEFVFLGTEFVQLPLGELTIAQLRKR